MTDHPRIHGDVTELRASVAGQVVTASDAGYDAARRCFNALVDRRPAVIVRCSGAPDVATAFDFARANDLEVAVRGGGHNPAGHCVLDDGLVIDLSLLRAVHADPESQVARAGGGSTWREFDSATLAAGLVTPGGVVGSTGVCGLTFGGGIGHLISQHGLTCDNLVGGELVTPDGGMVRVSATETPELLWGLRGGGGNFGVATWLEYQLHALPRVVGGLLVYRGEDIRDALRVFRDVVAHSPRELSCQAILRSEESGAPMLVVAPCYTGGSDDPKQLELLRAAPGLVEDGVRDHGFADQQVLFGDTYGVERNYWKGHFVRELPDELVDALLGRMVALGRPPGSILIESLHGAPKDVDAGSAAIGFRSAAFNISAMAVWVDPQLDQEQVGWARETAAAVEPWSVSGGYFNYMQADEPIERVRAAFGAEAFERLRALKRQYDPDNVLRRNQNIPPARGTEEDAGGTEARREARGWPHSS
jgi:FAD/FMN-containing dehydrogenase